MREPDALQSLPADVAGALQAWLADFDNIATTPLGQGYQASTRLFQHGDVKLVVKAVPRRSLWRPLLAFTLRHEYRVYCRLAGMRGIPRCHGLYNGRFLVLDYIDGPTLRRAELKDHDYFYRQMFALIQEMHSRGVAHIDLKRKDNILVVDGREPVFVDFGVAMVEDKRCRLINRYLMQVARRYDYNAWIKHKYRRQYHAISDEDRPYLRRTFTERFARLVKQTFKPLLRRRRRGSRQP